MKNRIEIKNVYEVLIIGGGPGGLAAALAAREEGARDILIVEREKELGGILNQCIHNGFGLHEFKEELTGPEYAARFIDKVLEEKIDVALEAMVIDITSSLEITVLREGELHFIKAKAVVLTMGCRERTAGSIALGGLRPAGICTAGMAQKIANSMGALVGKEIVIYGSGDIGLIMARRMTLEGAHIKAVIEIMPWSSGLKRNIAQCLEDFSIPLYLSTKIKEIKGDGRVSSVVSIKLDENGSEIPGSEMEFTCDTLLLSVGLIPENELSLGAHVEMDPMTQGAVVDSDLMTSVPGIFASGNVLHVHDIVDFVTRESRKSGKKAAQYALRDEKEKRSESNRFIHTTASSGVRYIVPQKVKESGENLNLFLRASQVLENSYLLITQGNKILYAKKEKIFIPSEMIYVEIEKEKLNFESEKDIMIKIVKEIGEEYES